LILAPQAAAGSIFSASAKASGLPSFGEPVLFSPQIFFYGFAPARVSLSFFSSFFFANNLTD
jgi:hypothetical protein